MDAFTKEVKKNTMFWLLSTAGLIENKTNFLLDTKSVKEGKKTLPNIIWLVGFVPSVSYYILINFS